MSILAQLPRRPRRVAAAAALAAALACAPASDDDAGDDDPSGGKADALDPADFAGQAVEGIAVIMAVYLTVSLSISTFMNWYNQRLALKGGR